jgi:phosphoribosylanthranilate isomerase
MVWIKICGITRASDAEAVSGMGADCLGFIFSTDSPRKISLEKARSITGGSGKASKTGVFVNEKTAMVRKYIEQLGLDNVQLSGDEGIVYIKELKRAVPGVKIIKAIRIREDTRSRPLQFKEAIKSFNGAAGIGRLILSGGLDHENIYDALSMTEPFGVDASSKLETAPGIKDLKYVEKFINEVRRYEKTIIK